MQSLLFVLILLLTGCGQMGNLYLPQESDAQQAAAVNKQVQIEQAEEQPEASD